MMQNYQNVLFKFIFEFGLMIIVVMIQLIKFGKNELVVVCFVLLWCKIW